MQPGEGGCQTGRLRHHLSGFGRRWQQRSIPARYPVSFLTAHVADQAEGELAGLLVFDHVENLPAIDERESGYDRVSLRADQIRLDHEDVLLPDVPFHVYVARPAPEPRQRHHVLQSYLDAVLQGYLHQYGELGARGFVQNTQWQDTPVMRDRSTPLYSRAVTLDDDERDLIDSITDHLHMVDEFL